MMQLFKETGETPVRARRREVQFDFTLNYHSNRKPQFRDKSLEESEKAD